LLEYLIETLLDAGKRVNSQEIRAGNNAFLWMGDELRLVICDIVKAVYHVWV